MNTLLQTHTIQVVPTTASESTESLSSTACDPLEVQEEAYEKSYLEHLTLWKNNPLSAGSTTAVFNMNTSQDDTDVKDQLYEKSYLEHLTIWKDNPLSGGSTTAVFNMNTSQDDTDIKDHFRFSKLKPKDLRFSEPVAQHIKTYMTARRPIHGIGEHLIYLWDPISNISISNDLQEMGHVLGGVGTFNSRGGFDVRFNIFMTIQENLNMNYSPPANFIPFMPNNPSRGSCLWSSALVKEVYTTEDLQVCSDKTEIQSGTYSFQSTRRPENPGSAILVAPGCSAIKFSLYSIPAIRQYLEEQVRVWYHPNSYPNGLYDNLSIGSLNLIHTCYNSDVWAAAALPKSSMNGEPLKARLLKSPQDPNMYEWDTQTRSPFVVNNGPLKRDANVNKYTVAVEVYQLDLPANESRQRSPLMNKIFGSLF